MLFVDLSMGAIITFITLVVLIWVMDTAWRRNRKDG